MNGRANDEGHRQHKRGCHDSQGVVVLLNNLAPERARRQLIDDNEADDQDENAQHRVHDGGGKRLEVEAAAAQAQREKGGQAQAQQPRVEGRAA
uniref:Uncharacterized protein n=1 Tax=Tanacetum cinerariifolium TaxID=118510 RepID=A0A699TI16_TANCI|nr:hypothetical protein [Tanacetum cinerariifolium]